MAEVRRGEIWLFGFPRPDKRRPVLVLTRPEIIAHLATVTVAPITTAIRGIPTEVIVGPESGLKTTSVVNLDHVATVPKTGLRSFVGTVPSACSRAFAPRFSSRSVTEASDRIRCALAKVGPRIVLTRLRRPFRVGPMQGTEIIRIQAREVANFTRRRGICAPKTPL